MKTGRYKKNTCILFFGPLKHIQNSKQSEADTGEPLLVSFENLNTKDVCIKNLNNTYCVIWEKYTVFKVYGTLETTESGNILETRHLISVHAVPGSLNIMTLLVTLARSEYRQYYRTQGQNNMLQSQWEKMKEEKKRLVKVKT